MVAILGVIFKLMPRPQYFIQTLLQFAFEVFKTLTMMTSNFKFLSLRMLQFAFILILLSVASIFPLRKYQTQYNLNSQRIFQTDMEGEKRRFLEKEDRTVFLLLKELQYLFHLELVLTAW